jgi:alanine-glyoxylate transaminase/serine-glyoxylate transaminase/serine-pyruvate transaminase
MLTSITNTLLMGPGPSNVRETVAAALALPTIGHLDPRFIEVMDRVKVMLRQVFQTDNPLTIPVSGTGSAGMETCFVNLLEPGDKVLILENGVFGVRMADVADRLGADVDVKEFEWGTPVDVAGACKAIESRSYSIVAIVHAETSTGVLNPVEAIAPVVRASGALFLVDTVTSLGGLPVTVDSWQADAVYSGTQKCLSCPPGLAPLTFSERARERLRNRKRKVPNWYLDLSLLTSYWEGEKRSYHHTAPVNTIYGLHQALSDLLDEGLAAAHERHRKAHEYLARELETIGLSLFVEPSSRLPMLNAVIVPEGTDETVVRERLLSEFGIEIGAGLGPLAGRIWRVGLMGHTARTRSVDRLIEALRQILGR